MRRSSRITRKRSILAPDIDTSDDQPPAKPTVNKTRKTTPNSAGQKRDRSTPKDIDEEFEDGDASELEKEEPAAKKQKSSRRKRGHDNIQLYATLFDKHGSQVTDTSACALPKRSHDLIYHRPLLLESSHGPESLLKWFDGVSSTRAMPWRKAWVDPRSIPDAQELHRVLERRAYEVWISEIMLQQTRVAVVIDYWNRWMEKWPTIHDLAAAGSDDVLAAWRGLGYYSRATRIHEAAKLVCEDSDMRGLLPSNAKELEAKIPGVGKYTAGAIVSIVFGRPAPMVDGNVLRVLSRQLGLLGDVKTNKSVIDLLWAAADVLVKIVASDHQGGKETGDNQDDQGNDRPGRWGQALMELGSTVCTPKPNCESCPITSTCRAYQEGLQLAIRKQLVDKSVAEFGIGAETPDIEDSCNFCNPFEEHANESEELDAPAKQQPSKKKSTRKQATLQSFAFATSANPKEPTIKTDIDAAVLEVVVKHARKFPVKTIKKAVREEEILVCVIRRSDGQYLIHRRPPKGLLAGLWEFPSYTLVDPAQGTAKTRWRDGEQFVAKTVGAGGKTNARFLRELGSVPWLFSHLRLTMHVLCFELSGAVEDERHPNSRWSDDIGSESMGTGMRKCWALVEAEELE